VPNQRSSRRQLGRHRPTRSRPNATTERRRWTGRNPPRTHWHVFARAMIGVGRHRHLHRIRASAERMLCRHGRRCLC
jgi:hypothetical protein